jgi:phosphoglycerate dehydrogenase-like enzyme
MEKGIILVALPPGRLSTEGLEQLRRTGGGRDVIHGFSREETEKRLDRTEIAMGDISFSLIPKMPRLTWVQLWSAGADQLQRYPAAKEHPFVLTGTSGIHGPQMAEHFFGMYFAWNRRFPAAFAARERKEWRKIPNGELLSAAGKTLLIAGCGAIGRTIARAAGAFGMKVIGLRRSETPETAQSLAPEPAARLTDDDILIAGISRLKEFLPRADVVLNILPLTGETVHFFGEAEFALMKPTALYANTGRGGTTCEAALCRALENKTIAGALLDVFEKEPLPPESPLWDMDNVIQSAHYAGLHPDYDALALDVALDNLERYVSGNPLRNVIDKTRGY